MVFAQIYIHNEIFSSHCLSKIEIHPSGSKRGLESYLSCHLEEFNHIHYTYIDTRVIWVSLSSPKLHEPKLGTRYTRVDPRLNELKMNTQWSTVEHVVCGREWSIVCFGTTEHNEGMEHPKVADTLGQYRTRAVIYNSSRVLEKKKKKKKNQQFKFH